MRSSDGRESGDTQRVDLSTDGVLQEKNPRMGFGWNRTCEETSDVYYGTYQQILEPT